MRHAVPSAVEYVNVCAWGCDKRLVLVEVPYLQTQCLLWYPTHLSDGKLLYW